MNETERKIAHLMKRGYAPAEIREHMKDAYPEMRKEDPSFQVIGKNTADEYTGPGPFDHAVFGELTLKNKSGEVLFVQEAWYPNGEAVFGTSVKSIFTSMEDEVSQKDVREIFRSLQEAELSRFYPYYVSLDQLTDERMHDILLRCRDTKNYGTRLGAHKEPVNTGYIEAFNTGDPGAREYLEIVKKGRVYTYTASHSSHFMQEELGELYNDVYPQESVSEPYVKIHEIEDLPVEYKFYTSSFRQMKRNLNEYLHRVGFMVTEEELQECIRAKEIKHVRVAQFDAPRRVRHIAEMEILTEDDQDLFLVVYDLPEEGQSWLANTQSVLDAMIKDQEASVYPTIVESTEDWQESKQSCFSKYYAKLEEIARSTFRSGKYGIEWKEGEEDRFDLLSLVK